MKLLIHDAVSKADTVISQRKVDGYSSLKKYAARCFVDFYRSTVGTSIVGAYDNYIYVNTFLNHCVNSGKGNS